MHHPTDRIKHTTAFVTPVMEHWLEREIAQWVHPMKDRSERSTSELRPAPRHRRYSYENKLTWSTKNVRIQIDRTKNQQ